MWGSKKEELALLAKCFVSIAAKEPRKRRADDAPPDYASMIPDERFFRFELERTLVNDDSLAADQQLAAIHNASNDFLGGQRTSVRHCVLALRGKLSRRSSFYRYRGWH
jgi:hypothetical protein